LKKITYLISNINKSLAFEWIVEELDKNRFDLSFILLNNGGSDLENFLHSHDIQHYRVHFTGKKSLPIALLKVLTNLCRHRPDVIHCHMFDACLIGLLAGKLLAIRRRIFTRHSGSYNWYYNKKGLGYDRLFAWLSTDVVAISQNVKNLLIEKECVPSHKVSLVHHGFKLDEFCNVPTSRVEALQQKYNPSKKRPVIGIISRWLHLKGIQYIIPAFNKLLKEYPDALLVLANAKGPYRPEIEKQLSELPSESYYIIPFENDLFALYQLFDVYVHTPINPTIEAFGQTYVEALASGTPSIFTLSGVAPEFIEHEQNALVVPFEDSDAIYNSMERLVSNNQLKERFVINGKQSVSRFALKGMIQKLEVLYQDDKVI
jgi:glycosyltransferase involved in cell wall biosynthesis